MATVLERSLSGVRLPREIEGLIERRGQRDMIVSENGTQMISHGVLGSGLIANK